MHEKFKAKAYPDIINIFTDTFSRFLFTHLRITGTITKEKVEMSNNFYKNDELLSRKICMNTVKQRIFPCLDQNFSHNLAEFSQFIILQFSAFKKCIFRLIIILMTPVMGSGLLRQENYSRKFVILP